MRKLHFKLARALLQAEIKQNDTRKLASCAAEVAKNSQEKWKEDFHR